VQVCILPTFFVVLFFLQGQRSVCFVDICVGGGQAEESVEKCWNGTRGKATGETLGFCNGQFLVLFQEDL
jgi:hypothetical protein